MLNPPVLLRRDHLLFYVSGFPPGTSQSDEGFQIGDSGDLAVLQPTAQGGPESPPTLSSTGAPTQPPLTTQPAQTSSTDEADLQYCFELEAGH